MEQSPWQRIRQWLYLFIIGVTRRMIVGCRAVMLDGDRVLLIRHTYVPGWHFPGGGVEPGETAAEGAAREAEEETGFRPERPMRLLGLYLQVNEATNRDHVAVYVADRFSMARTFTPNGEIAEIGWFPLDAPPTDTDPGTARRIAEIRAGSTPAERW